LYRGHRNLVWKKNEDLYPTVDEPLQANAVVLEKLSTTPPNKLGTERTSPTISTGKRSNMLRRKTPTPKGELEPLK
jgi:hypothetical protein